MATDLVLSTQKPAFLAKANGSAPASPEFSGGLGGGAVLPSLSFRGKMFRLRLDGQEVSTKKNTLEVVIAAARPSISKRFYDTAYDGEESASPRCTSLDGIRPDSADPISPACSACPNNVWGSATTATRQSKGKACSDYKRMVVYPVGLAALGIDPNACLLDIPASSLHAPKGGTEPMLREYIRMLERNGIAPPTYVAELSFTDDEYPRLIWTPKRYVTEAEHARVCEIRAEDDTQEALYGAERPRTQAAVAAPAAPAEPELPLEAPPAKARKAKAAAPAPAAAPAEDGDTEDLLAKLRDLTAKQ